MLAQATGCNDQTPVGHETDERMSEQPYWVEEVATDLDLPRAAVWLPDGDILIAEWAGKIRRVRSGKTVAWVEGVPKVYQGVYDGLRDIKLDPDFAENPLIYLTYTDATETVDPAQVKLHGRVLRARLEGNRLVNPKIIFTAVPTVPPGGPLMLRLMFLPDKSMLVGVGSGDQAKVGLVQRLDNHLGKIVRINRDGSVPEDNPFRDNPKALPEIWVVGLRNPSGFTRTVDGKLWGVDIGPMGGDEINLLERGGNYGWPAVSWGFDYSGKYMSERQSGGKGFTDPTLVWVPSVTPSDLIQYRGETYPFWNGDFFASGLSGQSLYRVRIKDDQVVLQERMLIDLNERLRTLAIGPDNLLYILTDAYGKGRLLRLVPGVPRDEVQVAKALFDRGSKQDERRKSAPNLDVWAEWGNYTYDPAESAQSFAQFCSSCHAFKQFESGRIGPDLNGIVGRRSGTLPDYAYSAGFTDPDHALTWNRLTLGGFLQAPQTYFPGTKMSIPALPPMELVKVVDFLTDGEKRKLD